MSGRIAVVTGANKGIGLAIVRQLALQYPKSTYCDGSLLVYLTARDQSRGEAALQSIYSDSQLRKLNALADNGGATTVKYHKLDISDQSSVDQLASFLGSEHPEGIDFLINNAGIALTGFDSSVVKETLRCNYYGTLEATQQILPLIKDGGRLVNVSSVSGQLSSRYSEGNRNSFLTAKSVSDITNLMENFTKAVADGKEKQQGWPSAAYAVSKAGVIGMTRAIALEEQKKGSKTSINSCCPGWVKTDMTKGKGSKTPDQGAETPVLLALGNIKGQTGLFWEDEKPIEW